MHLNFSYLSFQLILLFYLPIPYLFIFTLLLIKKAWVCLFGRCTWVVWVWTRHVAVNVAAHVSTDNFFSQRGPICSDSIQFSRNRTRYGSNLVRNSSKLDSIWPKYLLKKNVNFKLRFYLVSVSNFRYCILIYEYHVIVIYSLYYLLYLLNWYMFTIIYIYI